IATRRINQDLVVGESPAGDAVADHRQRRTVLDRAAGVHELGFCPNLDPRPRLDSPQPDEGGTPYKIDDRRRHNPKVSLKVASARRDWVATSALSISPGRTFV